MEIIKKILAQISFMQGYEILEIKIIF